MSIYRDTARFKEWARQLTAFINSDFVAFKPNVEALRPRALYVYRSIYNRAVNGILHVPSQQDLAQEIGMQPHDLRQYIAQFERDGVVDLLHVKGTKIKGTYIKF